MKQDVYRVALQEANAELEDITKSFEQLRQRKEQIATVLEALTPLINAQSFAS